MIFFLGLECISLGLAGTHNSKIYENEKAKFERAQVESVQVRDVNLDGTNELEVCLAGGDKKYFVARDSTNYVPWAQMYEDQKANITRNYNIFRDMEKTAGGKQ